MPRRGFGRIVGTGYVICIHLLLLRWAPLETAWTFAFTEKDLSPGVVPSLLAQEYPPASFKAFA